MDWLLEYIARVGLSVGVYVVLALITAVIVAYIAKLEGVDLKAKNEDKPFWHREYPIWVQAVVVVTVWLGFLIWMMWAFPDPPGRLH